MTDSATNDSISEALVSTLVEGLHMIGVLSQTRTDQAKGALVAIAAIYQTLRAGITGELTPETVANAMKRLHEQAASTDAKHDAALADKFDTSEGK